MKYIKWVSLFAILSLSGNLLAGCSTGVQSRSDNHSRQIVRADVLDDQEELLQDIGVLIDKEKAFDSGKYKAGEIPKGEYVFLNFNNTETPAHFKEVDGGENYFSSFGYVEVSGDHEVEVERGVIISIDELEALHVNGAKSLYEKYNSIDDYKGPGYYKIGTDLPKGEVKLKATGKNSYASLLTSPTRKQFNTLAVQHINDELTVDTNEAQYLNFTDATITSVKEGVSTKKIQSSQKVKPKKGQKSQTTPQYCNCLYVDPDIYVENTYILFMSYSIMLEINYYLNMMEYSQHIESVNNSNIAISSFRSDYHRTKNAILADRAIEDEKDATREEKDEASKVQEAAKSLLSGFNPKFVGVDGQGSLDTANISLEEDGIVFDGISISHDGELSNNDSETISLTYNGAVVAERSVKVSGLEDTPKENDTDIDEAAKKALDKASLSFMGTNGAGFAQAGTIEQDGYTFIIESDNRQDLSNGDEVPLYLIYEDTVVAERTVKVKGLEKETSAITDNKGYNDEEYPKDYKDEDENVDSNFDNSEDFNDVLDEEVHGDFQEEGTDSEIYDEDVDSDLEDSPSEDEDVDHQGDSDSDSEDSPSEDEEADHQGDSDNDAEDSPSEDEEADHQGDSDSDSGDSLSEDEEADHQADVDSDLEDDSPSEDEDVDHQEDSDSDSEDLALEDEDVENEEDSIMEEDTSEEDSSYEEEQRLSEEESRSREEESISISISESESVEESISISKSLEAEQQEETDDTENYEYEEI